MLVQFSPPSCSIVDLPSYIGKSSIGLLYRPPGVINSRLSAELIILSPREALSAAATTTISFILLILLLTGCLGFIASQALSSEKVI